MSKCATVDRILSQLICLDNVTRTIHRDNIAARLSGEPINYISNLKHLETLYGYTRRQTLTWNEVGARIGKTYTDLGRRMYVRVRLSKCVVNRYSIELFADRRRDTEVVGGSDVGVWDERIHGVHHHPPVGAELSHGRQQLFQDPALAFEVCESDGGRVFAQRQAGDQRV